MGRVNVFLKDQLLDEINEEAKVEGTKIVALLSSPLWRPTSNASGANARKAKSEKRCKRRPIRWMLWQKSWGSGTPKRRFANFATVT